MRRRARTILSTATASGPFGTPLPPRVGRGAGSLTSAPRPAHPSEISARAPRPRAPRASSGSHDARFAHLTYFARIRELGWHARDPRTGLACSRIRELGWHARESPFGAARRTCSIACLRFTVAALQGRYLTYPPPPTVAEAAAEAGEACGARLRGARAAAGAKRTALEAVKRRRARCACAHTRPRRHVMRHATISYILSTSPFAQGTINFVIIPNV